MYSIKPRCDQTFNQNHDSDFQPVSQEGAAAAIRKHQLNEAFAYGTIAPLVSLYCPLAPPSQAAAPYLWYDAHDRFQSSAILAAALDTVTMPYRLRRGFTPVSYGAVTGGGGKAN